MATQVASRWAGAIFEVTRPFGQEQLGQRNTIIKKSDRPTNQPTDGQSGLLSRVHATKNSEALELGGLIHAVTRPDETKFSV